MISLEDDQADLINRVVESMRRGNKSVLMTSATGSGKTYMASDIVRRAMQKGSVTWFVVPRRDLIRQTSKTYRRFGLPHGFIASGYHSETSQTYICSQQTLSRRLHLVRKPPQLAIIDECHYGGDGLDKIIKWLKANGSYIIGLSATPCKTSGQGMGMWYDDMQQGLSIRELIKRGRLSEYKAFAPSRPNLDGIKIMAGDYAQNQLAERMEGERYIIGDAVAHYKKHAMGKLNLSFGVSVKHSQQISEQFNNAGVPSAHLDADTPDHERLKIIRAYARRELLNISNCGLFGFGFDLGSQVDMDVCIESLSDLAPTISVANIMQRWGRVLRKKDYHALIFDHAGNIAEHGMPCQEREWTLQSREKRKRESSEKRINVKQCTACYYCHEPEPVCPNCGFVYPIQYREVEQKDGELEEIIIAEAKKKARVEVGRAKTIEQLRAIARERGYAPGWVFQMARIKKIRG